MLWKYNFSCRYSCEIQLPRDITLLARVATAFQNNKLHFFIVSLSPNPTYCHQRGQTSIDLCWLLHSRRVTSLWTIFSNSAFWPCHKDKHPGLLIAVQLSFPTRLVSAGEKRQPIQQLIIKHSVLIPVGTFFLSEWKFQRSTSVSVQKLLLKLTKPTDHCLWNY